MKAWQYWGVLLVASVAAGLAYDLGFHVLCYSLTFVSLVFLGTQERQVYK
jgi:hypothetical protein